MKFNINTWRKMYDAIHALHPFHDEKKIEEIKKRVSYYLDACGMHMPEPLWHYKAEDRTTWKWIPTTANNPEKPEEWTELNPDFAYWHLCGEFHS